MKKEYMCYCGLHCENCAVKAKVEPSAKVLYEEMKKAGFEDVIDFIPDGESFWRFLKGVSENGACVSCKEGSGDPGCAVRICALEKGVEMCALCAEYPCARLSKLINIYPVLKCDNVLVRDEGMEAWAKMQDARLADNYSYTD
jgi:hypothetical protein